MQKTLKNVTRIAALVCSVGLMAGCATVTQQQLDEVRAVANNALSEARSATERANNAHTVASDAAYAASEAQKKADAALQCCNDNSDKIDRMFQKAMRK